MLKRSKQEYCCDIGGKAVTGECVKLLNLKDVMIQLIVLLYLNNLWRIAIVDDDQPLMITIFQ